MAQIALDGIEAFNGQVFHWNWYTQTQAPEHNIKQYEYRDRGMARVLVNLNVDRNPKGKVVVWAHNWHLSKKGEEFEGSKMMGGFLAERLGVDYFSIGLVAYRTKTNWPGSEPPVEPTPREGSVEAILNARGQRNLLVSLATNDAFDVTRPQSLSIYAGSPTTTRLPTHFCALVFLRESGPLVHP